MLCFCNVLVLSSLCLSDQPFVYIDFDLEEFSQQARGLLEKRSPVIEGWFDENNRARVDWTKLENAIEKSYRYKDDGFRNTFF